MKILVILCSILNIIELQYSKISLEFDKLPNNSNVVFSCSAAFTNEIDSSFSSSNIYGICIKDGVAYNTMKKGIGMFAYYNNKFVFSRYASEDLVDKVIDNKGMLFQQYVIISNYKICPVNLPDKKLKYRVLGEKNGKLYIIECNKKIYPNELITALQDNNFKNVIYLDNGFGWDKSYKKDEMRINVPFPFTTNYITFYE